MKKYCELCGKEHDGSYGSGRFCSRTCARSFSTFKNRSEINKKVSDTFKSKNEHKQRYCKLCGKKIKYKNKSGYCSNCLYYSNELSEYRSNRSKYASSFIKHHVGWISRDKLSYAEKFWINVLDSNNIKYEHNKVIKRPNNNYYFLDFSITINDTNIDLEIDGKQHKYEDRIEHDIERDAYMKSIGYVVYRIDWNEINSDDGKNLMKSKIDNFLNFISGFSSG